MVQLPRLKLLDFYVSKVFKYTTINSNPKHRDAHLYRSAARRRPHELVSKRLDVGKCTNYKRVSLLRRHSSETGQRLPRCRSIPGNLSKHRAEVRFQIINQKIGINWSENKIIQRIILFVVWTKSSQSNNGR